MPSPALPTELWRKIFVNAIDEEFIEPNDIASDYTPFEPTHEHSAEMSLRTTLSISNVCVRWNQVINQFLYRKIFIRYGTKGLLQALGRETGEVSKPTFGHYVQCIELPPISANCIPDSEPCSIYDILARCPSVRFIIKHPLNAPSEDDFWSALASPSASIDKVTLDHLERIDWSSRMGRLRYNDHLNIIYPILRAIILRAPNLRYLSINDWKERMFDESDHGVIFPSLTTLRIRGATGFLSAGVKHIDIPKLTRLIVEPMNLYYRFDTEDLEILRVIGERIRCLELDGSPAGSEATYMGFEDILDSCVQLEELSFHVGAPPLIIHPFSVPHQSLKTLRIYTDMERYQRLGLGRDRYWELLTAALDLFLTNGQFPNLSRLVVHGDADAALTSNPRFHIILANLKARNIRIEYGDGRLIS